MSGCVSRDHRLRELLQACTHAFGTEFLRLDAVERDLGGIPSRMISRFVPPGTRASERQLSADNPCLQARGSRIRAKSALDLVIDREPLPGTNAYRTHRLPRDAQTPWSAGWSTC